MKIYLIVERALRDHEVEQIILDLLKNREYIYLRELCSILNKNYIISDIRVRKILNKLVSESKIALFRVGRRLAICLKK